MCCISKAEYVTCKYMYMYTMFVSGSVMHVHVHVYNYTCIYTVMCMYIYFSELTLKTKLLQDEHRALLEK